MIDESLDTSVPDDLNEVQSDAELSTDASPPDTTEADVDTENDGVEADVDTENDGVEADVDTENDGVEDGAESEQTGPRAALLRLAETVTSNRITSRDLSTIESQGATFFVACCVLIATLLSIPLIQIAAGIVWPLALINMIWR